MKIKVCGITSIEQLQQLDAIGVDFAGMIFYEKSARFVADKLKDHRAAILGLNLQRVGVFVNAKENSIVQAIKDYGLDYVQLHGDESPDFCKEVQQFAPVIKAIRIVDETNLQHELDIYKDVCTYFLFDKGSSLTPPEAKEAAGAQSQPIESSSSGGQYGGTGKKFDWQLLQTATIPKPFFLSGGIGEEDATDIISFQHPQLYSVDVNSRFETSAGVKDLEKVEAFITTLK